jgi:fermentation-respiration switch protein FrsA (DUF1100 family)
MNLKWFILVCLILLIFASFRFFYGRVENFLVFFPDRSLQLRPEMLHLTHREVYFNSQDGKMLHGWFFPQNKETPVILFSHGNAGNISDRLHNIRLLLDKGLQVFIFDYRGYGQSSGNPSEKGIYLDGLAAYDYLVQRESVPPERIILFGRSLGAAVAIEVALNRNVRSMIIESGFTSTKEMAGTMFPFSLVSRLLPANYNNLEKIGKVRIPKLIIHGDSDEIVPFAMGKRLFEASKEPKYFYALKGAGHNDTYVVGGEAYFRKIAAFARDSRI